MNTDKFKFVILTRNKTPAHSFKNGGKSWDEVKAYDNVGVLIPAPYIVLDFDTVTDAKKALEIVEAQKLKCNVLKTTRGYHLWFRSAGPYKNTIKAKLACGIRADIKCYGKPCYCKIKDDGVMRTWLQEHEENEVDYLPSYFIPTGNTGSAYNFLGMKSGDGRNQELYNYILYLQSKKFTKEQVRETIAVINKHIFKESLPEHELNTILRDESFKEGEELEQLQKAATQKGGFNHAALAQEIINSNKLVTVDQTIYIYKNGYYKPNEVELELLMMEKAPNISIRQRAEVMADLKAFTYVSRDKLTTEPYVINCENCRLNISTGERLEHTPDVIEFGKLPVVYDPDAYCKEVDVFLDNVFMSDKECIQLFYEILADILTKENIYQKAFLFVGNGANGKSKALEMLRKFVGFRYCSAISLEELNSKFKTAELENKLLNVGTDLENKPIKNSGLLKKIFSGDPITVERKFGKPFDLVSYATHIFSCNTIPSNSDKSSGMYRRWIIVPFDVDFTNSSKNDPEIGKKITTPLALSYLLNLALKGFKSLHKRKDFIEPERVRAKKEAYIVENSSVLSWIEDKEITLTQLVSEPRDALYDKYRAWCGTSSIKEVTSKTFYKELKTRYNLDTKQKFNDGKRYFIVKIDDI